MHLRFEGSKIRAVRPSEAEVIRAPARAKTASLAPNLSVPPTVGFLLLIRSDQGLLKLEATSKPAAAFARICNRLSFRLEVAFLGFLRADAYRQVEAAARAALERHRVNVGWFDCTPDVAIAAIRAAARGLDRKLVETSLGEVDESLRRAAAWTVASRWGQLRYSQRYRQFFAAALNGVGTGLLGAVVMLLSPEVHPAVIIGSCLLFGLILALLIDHHQRSIPPI